MDIIALIAEEKIKQAIAKGELKNLSGEGKPLKLQDLTSVPPELRAAYKILQNSGMLPEELEAKKEVLQLQDLIDSCDDATEKLNLKQQLSEKLLRFNLLMEKRKKGSYQGSYKSKIHKRLL